MHPRLQIGVEWNPNADEVGFIGNAILASETKTSPHISIGTSSDRIGTPPGPKSYYITFAKGFSDLNLAPYVSINYSEFDKTINFPCGVGIILTPSLRLMPMHDGRRSHLLLTYQQEKFSVSLMWVWFKHLGVSVSWGF